MRTVTDDEHDKSSQSADESKLEKNTQVGGSHEHSTVSGGSAAENHKQTASAGSGIKEIERDTSGVDALNQKTSVVSTVAVGASEAQNRTLPEALKAETTPERISSVDWRDSLLVNDTLANKKSLTAANNTVPDEEKKIVDFTNERHEVSDIDPNGNKSDIMTANYNRELDYSSREVK
ncbi:hypothetical protein MTO96_050695 [Rhipicephalus appendiculatus]